MSVESLEALKQQLSVLTAQEKIILGNYLLQQAKQEEPLSVPEETISELKRQKRMDWLKANREQYGGLYVALDGDVLLGTGGNFIEAAKIAREAGINDAFVDFLPPMDYVGSMGGW